MNGARNHPEASEGLEKWDDDQDIYTSGNLMYRTDLSRNNLSMNEEVGTWTEAGTLRPVPPFDFDLSLAFINAFPPTRHDQAVARSRLSRAFMIEGQPVAIRVTDAGTVDEPALTLALSTEAPITPALRGAAARLTTFYLSLDDDLAPFYQIGLADPAFAPVIARLYGYHQVRFPTPFECACWAILSQRTHRSIARRNQQSLAEALGQRLLVDGETLRAFPEPATVADTTPAALLALVRNERQARYLHEVAEAFVRADETFLRTAPRQEVAAWLKGIPGIGAWSASFILVRGLGRMDVTPPEVELERAAARRYGPLPPGWLDDSASRYGRWQGYWAHYLRVASLSPIDPPDDDRP